LNEPLTLRDIAPPPKEAFSFPPAAGTGEWERAAAAGREAIAAGSVGVLVLNGGMATRFSGVVKGVDVKIFGESFLYWKLRQARVQGQTVPVFVMNSPFTDEVTRRHLGEAGLADPSVRLFVQSVYPRERPDGSPFVDPEGRPSMAGRGHGDMLESFAKAGMLAEFEKLGCKTLMVSNVDNLGAMLDPVMAGMHLLSGKPVTVEAARRKPSHKGGIIASVRGRVQVFEGFRWPEGFDLAGYDFFNTNTFYLDRQVLAHPPDLALHAVVKEVGGQSVIQREKILGEVTELLDAAFLVVPDEGEGSRFIPVKTPEELDASLGLIRRVLGKWNL
jgi:UTP--glucose-1-phosphate uridylyltransferase